MQIIERSKTGARTLDEQCERATVYIDCADRIWQDVLTFWLTQSGFRIHRSPVPTSAAYDDVGPGTTVLLTDRFGPGLAGEPNIFELKARHPELRVVVIGSGDRTQPAQLSLAQIAGADATLPAPLVRERVLELMDGWS